MWTTKGEEKAKKYQDHRENHSPQKQLYTISKLRPLMKHWEKTDKPNVLMTYPT